MLEMWKRVLEVGVVLALILTPIALFGAPRTQTADCKETSFARNGWQDLARQEPRLQKHLIEIANYTNQCGVETVKVDNCHVRWPVNEDGNQIDGMRTVIISTQWESNINGEQKINQMGMKILYNKKEKVGRSIEGYKVFTISRIMKGFTLCWGPDGCGALGVPYTPKDDDTTGEPDPGHITLLSR